MRTPRMKGLDTEGWVIRFEWKVTPMKWSFGSVSVLDFWFDGSHGVKFLGKKDVSIKSACFLFFVHALHIVVENLITVITVLLLFSPFPEFPLLVQKTDSWSPGRSRKRPWSYYEAFYGPKWPKWTDVFCFNFHAYIQKKCNQRCPSNTMQPIACIWSLARISQRPHTSPGGVVDAGAGAWTMELPFLKLAKMFVSSVFFEKNQIIWKLLCFGVCCFLD